MQIKHTTESISQTPNELQFPEMNGNAHHESLKLQTEFSPK